MNTYSKKEDKIIGGKYNLSERLTFGWCRTIVGVFGCVDFEHGC